MTSEKLDTAAAAVQSPPAGVTSDESAGMAWWNALTETERRYWMKRAGDTGRVSDAWEAYRGRGNAVSELRAELRAGLDKVSPGPWRYYSAPLRAGMSVVVEVQTADPDAPIVQWSGFDNSYRSKAQHKRNARHIARCSPENIAALLDALEAAETRIEEIEKALARCQSVLATLIKPDISASIKHVYFQAVAAECAARTALSPALRTEEGW